MDELVAQATNDTLISALSFQLPSAANYVLSRHQSTFFPLGGDTYTPTGVRVIRFGVSDGTGIFLDPTSTRLMFRLRNSDLMSPLKLGGPPTVLFQRARLLVAGTCVEDISYLGRLHMLQHYCDVQERMLDNKLESEWDEPLATGASRNICMELPFGLLQADKYLSLRWCPLQIELELVSHPDHALIRGALAADGSTYQQDTFEISDVQLKADTVTCTPELVERYAKHLMGGGSLPITFSTWHSSVHVLPADNNFVIQTTRALSKLRSIFTTFWAPPPASNSSNSIAGALTESTYFYSPMAGAVSTVANDTMIWQYAIGARLWPVHWCRGAVESFVRLRDTLDMSKFGRLNIASPAEYKTHKFILAVDVERAGSASAAANFTGISTRSGEPIQLHVKSFTSTGQTMPSRAYIHLYYDAIARVTAAGCDLLD